MNFLLQQEDNIYSTRKTQNMTMKTVLKRKFSIQLVEISLMIFKILKITLNLDYLSSKLNAIEKKCLCFIKQQTRFFPILVLYINEYYPHLYTVFKHTNTYQLT